jgi:hypothetical protein
VSDIMAQAMEAMEEADRIDGETYALAEAMMLGEAMDPDRTVTVLERCPLDFDFDASSSDEEGKGKKKGMFGGWGKKKGKKKGKTGEEEGGGGGGQGGGGRPGSCGHCDCGRRCSTGDTRRRRSRRRHVQ